jgi:hypothetical protein
LLLKAAQCGVHIVAMIPAASTNLTGKYYFTVLAGQFCYVLAGLFDWGDHVMLLSGVGAAL